MVEGSGVASGAGFVDLHVRLTLRLLLAALLVLTAAGLVLSVRRHWLRQAVLLPLLGGAAEDNVEGGDGDPAEPSVPLPSDGDVKQNAKRMAFIRAADELQTKQVVATNRGRVWVVRHTSKEPDQAE